MKLFIIKQYNNMNIRKCLFCGEDISHKNQNAIICGCKECVSKYDKWRRERKKNGTHRFCKICGECIDNLPPQQKICQKEECKKRQEINRYHSKLYIKTCERCGEIFEATNKQKLCEKCRKEYRKDVIIEDFEQKVVCKDCGKLIRTQIKKNAGGVSDIIYELCNECKEKHKLVNKEISSKRMKENNPMFNDEIKKRVSKSLRDNYISKCIKNGEKINPIHKQREYKETLHDTKMRMMIHNPMYNEETRKKATETFKKKIENGEIQYKRGKESPLWKGNRTFNKAVRIELRKWVRKKFEEVNFTCQLCGKTKTELHVHHIKPLREIIQEYLDNNNLTIEYVNSIEGNEEYLNIIQEIVKYHYDNMDIGIVVCPECHNKTDNHYKRKSHDKKH